MGAKKEDLKVKKKANIFVLSYKCFSSEEKFD